MRIFGQFSRATHVPDTVPGTVPGTMLAVLVLVLVPVSSAQVRDEPESTDNFGKVVASGDFDGDGFGDLAVSVPGEDIDGKASVGAVHILYGMLDGLSVDGNDLWYPDNVVISGAPEAFDRFGEALAVGDFNNDGYDDLAVGTPNESVGVLQGAGAVNVLYGREIGLFSTDNEHWHQDSKDIMGSAEADDLFGAALAVGDINGDGFDDLAIGAPGEDTDLGDVGFVHILFGTTAGLTGSGSQGWFQDDAVDADGASEENDRFGYSLASGDFDGDGFDDLAIGTPWERVLTVTQAGLVNVLYGTTAGLTNTGDQQWTQNGTGLNSVAEDGDFFGWAVTADDFDGDGFADLAVGAPFEDLNSGPPNDIGIVHVIYGRSSGLSGSGSTQWGQNTADVQGVAEVDDWFGYELATGDLNGDGFADLVVGAPGESILNDNLEGVTHVLYGSADGVEAAGNEYWNQVAFDEDPATGDRFGGALATGDYDGDGFADLALGIAYFDIGSIQDAGIVQTIYGTADGASVDGSQRWFQGADPSVGVEGASVQDGGIELTAWPNPTADRASISIALHDAASVRLTVHDALGRRVAVLLDAVHPSGTYNIPFNADGLPSGMYFVRLEAAGVVRTHRLVVVR